MTRLALPLAGDITILVILAALRAPTIATP